MSRIDLVALAQETIAHVLHAGDIAIDATVGNGHDTLFLAHCVGPSGHVYGFDIQHSALANAQQRLSQQGIASRVTLVEAGHETLAAHLPLRHQHAIKAVMFNLGYLPGSEKTVTTSPATTMRALTAACAQLASGGVISVVAYTGHPGGHQETEAIKEWARQLDAHRYDVTVTVPEARHSTPPELIIIRDRR